MEQVADYGYESAMAEGEVENLDEWPDDLWED
jgi:hypothetical protein